jgi:hypothetical protein
LNGSSARSLTGSRLATGTRLRKKVREVVEELDELIREVAA